MLSSSSSGAAGSEANSSMERSAGCEKTPTGGSGMTLATIYLMFYNVSMTAGWLTILLRLINAVRRQEIVYDAVATPLKIFQTGALLEILHAATRLIRAHPAVTAWQVASRIMLLWGVVEPVISVRKQITFVTMVLAWSLTEIPRYFYFSVGALGDVPYWVMITRYTTFIPLYPLGAGSEWLTLLAAMPYIKQTRILSVFMPNRFNFTFDYYFVCSIILALYIPGLPYMYFHMLHQRRKNIASFSALEQRTAKQKSQ